MDAVNDNSYDYSLVALTEADIDDPRVHIDLENLVICMIVITSPPMVVI